MIRQPQLTAGYPLGDCVRASWASLLEIPIAQVPRFDPAALGADDGIAQESAERRWLASLGMDLVVVRQAFPHPGVPVQFGADTMHLIDGRSPRHPKFGHRVVGQGGKVVWDPHPSGAGVTEVFGFMFAVPKNPALRKR